MVNFKIYSVTDLTTNNYNAHFANISGSKGNQTKKIDQLIKYNIRNIFLKKSYTKCIQRSSPRPFYKKSNFSTPVDQLSEML